MPHGNSSTTSSDQRKRKSEGVTGRRVLAAGLTGATFALSSGLTCDFVVAGLVELPHVEFQPNDGKHEDGHEQQQANLQQGNHSLHDGLEDHLEAWRTHTRRVTDLRRVCRRLNK